MAHWNFDGLQDGAETAADRSGRGAECRLTNAKFTARGDGLALQCGSDVAETVGHATLATAGIPRDAVTLAAWVRLDEAQPYARGNSGIVESRQRYRLMVRETEPPYSVSFDVLAEDGTWGSVGSPRGGIEAGQWVHAAGTYDSETGESVFYLNGEPVAGNSQRPGRIRAGGESIAIGLRDGVAYLSGAVDDVRVYDRVLGAAAVAAIAKNP